MDVNLGSALRPHRMAPSVLSVAAWRIMGVRSNATRECTQGVSIHTRRPRYPKCNTVEALPTTRNSNNKKECECPVVVNVWG